MLTTKLTDFYLTDSTVLSSFHFSPSIVVKPNFQMNSVVEEFFVDGRKDPDNTGPDEHRTNIRSDETVERQRRMAERRILTLSFTEPWYIWISHCKFFCRSLFDYRTNKNLHDSLRKKIRTKK